MLMIIWLLGWPCMMMGAWLIYIMLKKVVIPHNKFVFENSNEHGVVALPNWEEAVKFQKSEAKKEILELVIGFPGAIMLAIGVMMIAYPTCSYLFG